MKFWAWHSAHATTAQLPWHVQFFLSDMVPYNKVTLKRIFHRIWITIEKSFVNPPTPPPPPPTPPPPPCGLLHWNWAVKRLLYCLLRIWVNTTHSSTISDHVTKAQQTLCIFCGKSCFSQIKITRIPFHWQRLPLTPAWISDYVLYKVSCETTVKPVYNDHLMGYFSAFRSSSRWLQEAETVSQCKLVL